MKKLAMFLSVVIVMSLLIAGCVQDDYSNATTTTGEMTASDAEMDALVNESYYRVWEEDGLYSFAIYDKGNNIVQLNENRTKQPEITMINDGVVCVTEQAGTGIATSITYYYDVVNNQFSDYYTAVFDQGNGLVVCAEADRIIIRDIFDDSGFYQEITHFGESFSPAAFPFIGAKLNDNATAVRVVYLAGGDYTETSEVFELQDG